MGPTQSGSVRAVIPNWGEPEARSDANVKVLGKYLAPPLAGTIFLFIMYMFYLGYKQQVTLMTQQMDVAQTQVAKFYQQTSDQHALDRLSQVEQRLEDRKIRREELQEQKANSEKLWSFTRELQLILVEDSGAIKQLKDSNRQVVKAVEQNQQAVQQNQQTIMELLKKAGMKLDPPKSMPFPEDEDDY